MKEHEYAAYLLNLQERTKVLEPFKEKIIDLYEQNEFKKLNMAAVHDYLTEHYELPPCTEKTVRNYITFLIEKEKLSLKTQVRMYEKVPELRYGKQMQLDFGQITQNGVKFYILCALLSASRYKYAVLSDGWGFLFSLTWGK